MENPPSDRKPKTLTGVVTIEWADASEPDDPNAEPNFGWSLRLDRPMDDARLKKLLIEVAESEHLNYQGDDSPG